ncbi:MAG TPA: hypothetical protein PK006_08450 [Saprospiraceae bacterium]|nr:hypothetical protein [Saprospiraceae bacterium]
MGRYWDDPRASLLQHLGLGSVIYIFCLAFFIWLIVLPLKVDGWTYKITLTFIALTSFPALFYAIPVERFYSLETANSINVWFLAIVALWRLFLLYFFLYQFSGLTSLQITTVTLLPICLIISILTYLNLHKVVFNIMGGTRVQNPQTESYLVLFSLTILSAILLGPLLVLYGIAIYQRQKKKN